MMLSLMFLEAIKIMEPSRNSKHNDQSYHPNEQDSKDAVANPIIPISGLHDNHIISPYRSILSSPCSSILWAVWSRRTRLGRHQGLLLQMIPEKTSLWPRLRRQKLNILEIDYHFSPLNLAVPQMLKVIARDLSLKDSSYVLVFKQSYDPSRLLFPPSPNYTATLLNCSRKPAQSQYNIFQSSPPSPQQACRSLLPSSSKSTATMQHLNLHFHCSLALPIKHITSCTRAEEMRSTEEQIITWQNYHDCILPAWTRIFCSFCKLSIARNMVSLRQAVSLSRSA